MATAADIMTKHVVTVAPDKPVGDVADMLANYRFGAVPVVDADGAVLGIVSEEDLVQRSTRIHVPRYLTFLGAVIFLEDPRRFEEDAEKILAVTAREIMEETFATVAPETPVREVATRLLDEDLRRLLVLDTAGHLLGIITRADIVRMLAEGNGMPE